MCCQNVSKDVASVASSGRPFQILGHAAVANEWSPTVAWHGTVVGHKANWKTPSRVQGQSHGRESMDEAPPEAKILFLSEHAICTECSKNPGLLNVLPPGELHVIFVSLCMRTLFANMMS